MTLPNNTIFEFYEGTETSKYTELNSTTLNSAPNQLLENDKYLDQEVQSLKESIAGGEIEIQPTQLPKASETQQGIIEIATQEQVSEGRSNITAVTPAYNKVFVDTQVNRAKQEAKDEILEEIGPVVDEKVETAVGKVQDEIDNKIDQAVDTAKDSFTDSMQDSIDQAIQDKIESGEIGGGGSGDSSLVVTPTLLAPADGDVNVSTVPTLKATAYLNVLETDPRLYRSFEVVNTANNEKVVSQQANADEFKVTTPLTLGGSYKWRCRDTSTKGLKSGWTKYAAFSVASDVYVETPTLMIVGSSTNVMETPSFNTSAIAIVPDQGNSVSQHQSSSWTLISTEDDSVVWESKNDTTNKTSLTLPRGYLKPNLSYIMKVTHNSTNYGSSASGVVFFTCASRFTYVDTPVLICTGGTTNVMETPTITGSQFTVLPSGEDTHEWTTWTINIKDSTQVYKLDKSSTSLTTFNVPSGVLVTGQTYVVSAVYHGAKYGDSAAGTVEFSTAEVFTGPKLPTLQVEGTESTAVTYLSEFKASDPVYINGEGETCDKAEWVLYKGEEQVWQKADATGIAITDLSEFNGYKPENSTEYQLRYRQHFTPSNSWSGYATLDFTTALKYGYPTIKFKARGTLNLNKITAWWDYTILKVYIDETYNETLTQSPATDLALTGEQTIEIVNETDGSNYPYVCFSPNVSSLQVTEMLAPLPLLRISNGGAAITDFGGDVGVEQVPPAFTGRYGNGNGSPKYGMFSMCSTLVSLCDQLFRFNPQVINFGGYGGGGGGGGYSGRSNGGDGGGGDGGGAGGNNLHSSGGAGGFGYGCFHACTGLTSLPADLFKYCVNVTNFGGYGGGGGGGSIYSSGGTGGSGHGCFYQCTSLTSLPADLFKYCVNVTNFGGYGGGGGGGADEIGSGAGSGAGGRGYGCFNNCTSLTSLPADLFKYCVNVTNFGGYGGGNGGRGSGGADGSTAGSGNVGGIANGCFNNCTSLTSLPADLFKYCTNVTNFSIYSGGGGGIAGTGGGKGGEGGGDGASFGGVIYGGGGGGGGGAYGGGGGGYSKDNVNGNAGQPFKNPDLISTAPAITTFTANNHNGTFANCTNLTTINQIYGNNTKMQRLNAEFKNCTKLASIPTNLFANLTGLKYVNQVFSGCKALKLSARFKAKNIENVNQFGYGFTSQGTVYVPSGSKTATTFKSDSTSNCTVVEE